MVNGSWLMEKQKGRPCYAQNTDATKPSAKVGHVCVNPTDGAARSHGATDVF